MFLFLSLYFLIVSLVIAIVVITNILIYYNLVCINKLLYYIKTFPLYRFLPSLLIFAAIIIWVTYLVLCVHQHKVIIITLCYCLYNKIGEKKRVMNKADIHIIFYIYLYNYNQRCCSFYVFVLLSGVHYIRPERCSLTFLICLSCIWECHYCFC